MKTALMHSEDLSAVEINIGVRLKLIRKSRNMTIKELAQQANVSAGAISQIERNLANPTVRVLEQLRVVLNVPLTAFLEQHEVMRPGAEHYVRRWRERPHFQVGKHGISKEMLSPSGEHDIQFMYISIPPRTRSEEMLTGIGEKAGVVMEGRLALEVNGETTFIEAGDSFQFKSHLPHNIFNDSDTEARVLWIMHIPPRHHI
ncbi:MULTISPECIES: cupin domain-containing protein [Pantoea]|nr:MULTISPECIES: cupin domain-containing protein [Pantoea]MDI3363152.1 cupin domain-containing protein [Pantoea sp. V108_6]CCF11930.1 transcriptional regulator, XRE family [Pantoea ananatis LMG 5342]